MIKSVYYVSLWRDGVWARTGDNSAGLFAQQVYKDSFKQGPVPPERRALRFHMVDLSPHKGGATDSVQTCKKMWTTFATVLKVTFIMSRCVLHHGAINRFPGHQPYLFLTQEAEAIFVWYPGLYFLSYSLCPHCRNPACPSEYHDGHELATSKGMKCKSCNKEVPVQYLIKPH